jgi:hypothetical protein
MVEEQRFQVSTTTHTEQSRLQRLSVASGAGMGAQLSIMFSPLAEAKPEDTCAYSRRGWSANTHI